MARENPKRRKRAKKKTTQTNKAKRRFDGLTPIEWARRAMERNAAAIDASPRGTPAGKPSGYKLGTAPSSYRQGRRH